MEGPETYTDELVLTLIILSRVVRKWAFEHMQTAKLQASLGIRAVSPEALIFSKRFIKAYCYEKQTAKLLG